MSLLQKFERYPAHPTGPDADRVPCPELFGGRSAARCKIYAKRDDLQFGPWAMGGKQAEKARIQSCPTRSASGADTLVSIGGVQSNHTRMGGGDGRKDRYEMRRDSGEVGAALRRRLRPRRQYPD